MATAIVILVALNSSLLVNRVENSRDRQQAETIGKRLVDRSRRVQELQDGSNEHRETISEAFDALDGISNSARAVGGTGISEAHGRLLSAAMLFDEARRSNIRLPVVTQQIIMQSRRGRKEIDLLLDLVAEGDLVYLNSFDGALELLIKTHQAYSRMNAKITEAFKLYEALFAIEDNFLTEEAAGGYRNRKEASRIFRERTASQVKILVTARAEIRGLDVAASDIAERAHDAFERASRLRPKP